MQQNENETKKKTTMDERYITAFFKSMSIGDIFPIVDNDY